MMKSQLQVVQRFLPDWGITYGPAGDGPFRPTANTSLS
jgi:hypothetical protein